MIRVTSVTCRFIMCNVHTVKHFILCIWIMNWLLGCLNLFLIYNLTIPVVLFISSHLASSFFFFKIASYFLFKRWQFAAFYESTGWATRYLKCLKMQFYWSENKIQAEGKEGGGELCCQGTGAYSSSIRTLWITLCHGSTWLYVPTTDLCKVDRQLWQIKCWA